MKTRTARRAFTLVELLVAAGVTATLAGLLLALVANTLEVWERTATRLALENRVQTVLDQMAEDLATAVWVEEVAGAVDPTAPNQIAVVWRGRVVQAATAGEATPGVLPREVGYFWRREADGAGPLFRWEGTAADALSGRNPEAEFAEGIQAEFVLAEHVAQVEMEAWTPGSVSSEGEAEGPGAGWVRIELTLVSVAERGRPPETAVPTVGRTAVRWVAVGGAGR